MRGNAHAVRIQGSHRDEDVLAVVQYPNGMYMNLSQIFIAMYPYVATFIQIFLKVVNVPCWLYIYIQTIPSAYVCVCIYLDKFFAIITAFFSPFQVYILLWRKLYFFVSFKQTPFCNFLLCHLNYLFIVI